MQLKGTVEPAATGAGLLHAATMLPLKSHLLIPPFMSLAMRVAQQLRNTPGLVRFAMKADLPKKTFWTYTAWKDRESMAKFVGVEPHATAVKKFWGWRSPGGGVSVHWTDKDRQVDWRDVSERLKTPTRNYS